MQPQTSVRFDSKSFERIKATIANISKGSTRRKYRYSYAEEIPNELGFQLTRRCNLRCTTCFLWNENGNFTNLDSDASKVELDTSIFEKVLHETHEVRSKLFIWGAEPLMHTQWEDISKIIKNSLRWTVICTNGLLLEKKMESLLGISKHLAIVVSLDGFKDEHDHIRGKGTFDNTIKNIELLLKLKSKGQYKGEISLHCVLNNHIIKRLYELLEYAEILKVNTIYFGFPWYISPKSAIRMDNYYKKNFYWLNSLNTVKQPSWYSYSYHLNEEIITELKKQVSKINSRVWNIRVRLQPALEINEFEKYILGEELPAQKRIHCYASSYRLDILANGNVTACQPFEEFSVGNLYEKSLLEIWHSDKYNKIRKIISKELMPVCSKCILLYLNGR